MGWLLFDRFQTLPKPLQQTKAGRRQRTVCICQTDIEACQAPDLGFQCRHLGAESLREFQRRFFRFPAQFVKLARKRRPERSTKNSTTSATMPKTNHFTAVPNQPSFSRTWETG